MTCEKVGFVHLTIRLLDVVPSRLHHMSCKILFQILLILSITFILSCLLQLSMYV